MDIFSPTLSLENNRLLLRPSTLDDQDGLTKIADSSIWTHSSTNIRTQNREDVQVYLQNAIQKRESHILQQLTIIDKSNNILIGCSSFENISQEHKRLEIGWTWLGKQFQGTGLNPIAKYLMLRFVFEELGFERVEFRARGTNLQSQRALEKIGAVREGTIRSYFEAEGKRHDFVYFSILKDEWPELKATVFSEMEAHL